VLGFLEGDPYSTSISVAILTRWPMLAILVVCILIFFWDIEPGFVELASQGRVNEAWGFMARVLPGPSFAEFFTPVHRFNGLSSPGLPTLPVVGLGEVYREA